MEQAQPVSSTIREFLWRDGHRYTERPGEAHPPQGCPVGASWWRHAGERLWRWTSLEQMQLDERGHHWPLPDGEVPATAIQQGGTS